MFWEKKHKSSLTKSKTSSNTVIYCIGDIHGSIELLNILHDKIISDSKKYSEKRKVLVYLGDYIDRGVNSKEVVDLLLNNPLVDFEKVYLRGNHEQAIIDFIASPESSKDWLVWGGDSTLRSYGVFFYDKKNSRFDLQQVRDDLNKLIPQSHYTFYRDLKVKYIDGDYIFVHAGLKPKVSIENQVDLDLITIRDEFVSCKRKFEKKVVFGHTIFQDPYMDDVKIGIDTGAYLSGKLTCVVLEDEKVRFITSND